MRGLKTSAPAGQGAQPCRFQLLQGIPHGLAAQVSQVLDLYTGKGLNMDLRSNLFDSAQGLKIIRIGKVRVNATHHVDLGDGLVLPRPDLVLDLCNPHLIGQRITFFFAKGAEFTEIGTDIGIINMLVIDKKGLVAVFAFPHDVGKIANSEDIRAGKEMFAIFQRETFFGPDLGKDIAQSGLLYERVH